jgi:hypothetical protein
MGKWLVDSLTNGTFGTTNTYYDSEDMAWQTELSSKELYQSYLNWMDSQKTGEYNRFTQTGLGKYLTEIGFNTRKSNGVMVRNMGSLESAITKFECYEKVKI